MHIILAHDPPSYRSVLAPAIRALRPDLNVSVVDPADLDREVTRRAPQVVVCSELTPAVRTIPLTWILLYPDYGRGAEVSVAGRHSTMDDLDLDTLLALVDRTQRLADGGAGERRAEARRHREK